MLFVIIQVIKFEWMNDDDEKKTNNKWRKIIKNENLKTHENRVVSCWNLTLW